nr:integrase, catalytic region, zinc finger, CCHC-type, peptidase aspartic, catalytic [Tanacetum cinerariifolium]
MDDPNNTIEEYIRLEEEIARRRGKVYNWETATYGKIWYNEDVHDLRSIENEFPVIVLNDALTSEVTLSCKPTVSPLNDNKINFKISFDESDDEDYTVIYDKNSFSYKIIFVNNLKMDSKNDNDKVNMPLLPSPEPTVNCFDDLEFFKDFKNEFPAIVYNDAQMSKSDFLVEPTDNNDDKINIERSSEDMSVIPLPDVINTDVGAYAQRHAFWSLKKDILKIIDSDIQYAASIEEDTVCASWSIVVVVGESVDTSGSGATTLAIEAINLGARRSTLDGGLSNSSNSGCDLLALVNGFTPVEDNAGCDLLALVNGFTPVEDNAGKYTVLAVCQIVHCASGLSLLTAVCLIRQKFANSEDIQCAGSDTRPPMLDRIDFASWQQRIRLYCRGKENGVNILKLINEGPFQMGTFRETLGEGEEGAFHLGPKRPRVYFDLSPKEKDRVDRLEVRGTMNGVQVQLVMWELRTELAMQIQVKQGKLNVDEQPVQDLALNVDNVFQADDCDAFDSGVDEAPTAQTMFMENLSSADPVYDEVGPSYDSDILSEVHDHDHYQDAVCEHHEVHEMHDDVQPNYVVDSHANIRVIVI